MKDHTENEEDVYPFLRLGIPADRDMPDRLLIQAHVEALGKELYNNRDLLIEKQSKKQEKKARIEREIQEVNWVYSNNVKGLAKLLSDTETQENVVNRLLIVFDRKREELREAKEKHPEYDSLSSLKTELEEKQAKYDELNRKQVEIEESQTRVALELRVTRDCIVQHKEYQHLKEKESQHMSLEAQEQRIQGVKSDISNLEKEKKEIQADLKVVDSQIEDYENTGFLGRIGKKKTYETAVEKREQLKKRSSVLLTELTTQYELSRKYDDEITATRLLRAQIEKIHISKTIDYWEAQERKHEETAKILDNQNNQVVTQMSQVYDRLKQLRRDIQQIEKQCQTVVEAENEYAASFQEIKEAKGKLKQIQKRLEETYQSEIDKCALFFIPAGKSYRENISFLEKKLDDLSYTYVSVSVENLEKEKDVLIKELLDIQNQLNEIEQKLATLENQVIMESRVIGTTLAKSYLCDPLQERKFDTVILDEASMASIPALWCASCLAECNIVIVGDFLQLSPIVIAETPEAKEWLGKDIFEKSGMVERLKQKKQPDNFVMLNDQFRMEKEIADIANNLYYGEFGGLKSKDHAANRDKERARFLSWYSGNKDDKHCVHLIDTENMHAWVTGVQQGKGHSRFNSFSAALDVNMAFTLIENKLNSQPVSEPVVLIVVPYKPHANLIQKMIDLEYKNRGMENKNLISVGTVHSFQGKEADIVIFDLVVDEPHWRNNLFISDDISGDSLERMFNVAVTRARFQLYVVGNFKFCISKAKTNALGRFLSYLINTCQLKRVDAKRLFPNMKYIYCDNSVITDDIRATHMLCRDDSFDKYFIKDLLNAKERIIIFSPFMTENRVSTLLPYFEQAHQKGILVVVVTKDKSELKKEFALQKQLCESALKKHGVHLIYRKGMHEKIILIDNSVVWNGSLNVLSFSGATGEVMERFACSDKYGEENNILDTYMKAYDIEHMLEVVEDETQGICPICHGTMILREGDEGERYWQCENKDYSRSTTQPYPKDGEFHCKVCGGKFCYKRKNQPRWVCENNSAHYQKVRKSDLKLPKMRALIPSEQELKYIDEYFESNKSHS